tara:strand:+ start:6824 stop:6979 length:156 start_codon:yes stop_codon:yes gene_type:complete
MRALNIISGVSIMAANLGLVLFAVTTMFVLFMAALAYGAWSTRNIKLTKQH